MELPRGRREGRVPEPLERRPLRTPAAIRRDLSAAKGKELVVL